LTHQLDGPPCLNKARTYGTTKNVGVAETCSEIMETQQSILAVKLSLVEISRIPASHVRLPRAEQAHQAALLSLPRSLCLGSSQFNEPFECENGLCSLGSATLDMVRPGFRLYGVTTAGAALPMSDSYRG